NGGSSWQEAAESHADYHVMAATSAKNQKIYIGNDGGMYEYDWSALLTSPVDLNTGLNITQFYTGAFFPEGVSVIGGCQDNGTNYSFDANPVFKKAYGADGSYTQVNQQDPD